MAISHILFHRNVTSCRDHKYHILSAVERVLWSISRMTNFTYVGRRGQFQWRRTSWQEKASCSWYLDIKMGFRPVTNCRIPVADRPSCQSGICRHPPLLLPMLVLPSITVIKSLPSALLSRMLLRFSAQAFHVDVSVAGPLLREAYMRTVPHFPFPEFLSVGSILSHKLWVPQCLK
jgi:hypothetical protein